MSRFYTPMIVLPLGVVVMGALIAGAYRADVTRLEVQRHERLRGADAELRTLESRLVRILEAQPDVPASLVEARRIYAAAMEPAARHEAFESLAAAASNYFSTTHRPGTRDPSVDEAAGLVNRWKLAIEHYRRAAGAER